MVQSPVTWKSGAFGPVSAMLVMPRGALPALVMMMFWTGVVALIAVAMKESEVGDRATAG